MDRVDRQRLRVARSVAAFWDGGAGPSHGDLTAVLQPFGLHNADPNASSKRERVEAAIRMAGEEMLPALLDELIHVLADFGMFDTQTDATWAASRETIGRAQRDLAAAGFHLTHDGQLQGSAVAVDLTTLRTASEVREHLDRIQRAVADDPPLVIGSCKDLIEATCKMILGQLGRAPGANPKMPALIKETQEALGLHSASIDKTPATEPIVRILGSLSQIALSVNELRRTGGTGHGRAQSSYRLLPRHARLVAGATATYCTLLLDTFTDPDAPWRDDASAD